MQALNSTDGFRKRKLGLPTLPCSFGWFVSDNPQKQFCNLFYGSVMSSMDSKLSLEKTLKSSDFTSGLLWCCKHIAACVCARTPYKSVCETGGMLVTSSQRHSFCMNRIYCMTINPGCVFWRTVGYGIQMCWLRAKIILSK